MRHRARSDSIHQPEALVVLAAIVFAAAREAGDGPANAPHAREIFRALRATIEKTSRTRLRWERQSVTTLFVANPEIAASPAPFFAVRRNASPPRAGLCNKMRQLMAQRPINLGAAVLVQARI